MQTIYSDDQLCSFDVSFHLDWTWMHLAESLVKKFFWLIVKHSKHFQETARVLFWIENRHHGMLPSCPLSTPCCRTDPVECKPCTCQSIQLFHGIFPNFIWRPSRDEQQGKLRLGRHGSYRTCLSSLYINTYMMWCAADDGALLFHGNRNSGNVSPPIAW